MLSQETVILEARLEMPSMYLRMTSEALSVFKTFGSRLGGVAP